MTKKLPQPLLLVTWFYAITSVLGVVAYPVLSYATPIGTFGSRFYVYLFYIGGLEETVSHSGALIILAVAVAWVITLLISCIMAFWKNRYRLFRRMVLADIVATFGFLVYIFIRDGFYWGWFFSNIGWGFALNVIYLIWFSRTIRRESQSL